MSEYNNTNSDNTEESQVDWLLIASKYLGYWYWFVLSVMVCVIGANVYLRYMPNSYMTSAKIKILDNSNNSFKMPSDAISLFARSKLNLENEVEVIKSNRIMEKVVQKLNLTTVYTQTGYVKSSELWEDRPFDVEWIGTPQDLESSNHEITIQVERNGYIVKQGDEEKRSIRNFNEVYSIDNIKYKISKNNNLTSKIPNNNSFGFSLLTNSAATARLVNQISVENIGKQSEILALKITGTNKEKSEAILNALLNQFDWDGIVDRQLISQRTIDFVNERFVNLTRELDSIETGKELYKKSNELSFLEEDAGISAEIKTKPKTI